MHLLIPAAGSGSRMGREWLRRGQIQRNKLLLTVLEKPIIAWTLLAAEQASHIEWIGLIGQPIDHPDFQEIVHQLPLKKPVVWIQGGDTRQESVYNGLQSLPAHATGVLIHDGARCLATPELFDRCGDALTHCSGLIAAIPVKDTIKVIDAATHCVQSTPERRHLWAAQTPQGFDVRLLKQCHDQGRQSGWEVTDDAALFERCQLPVQIVEGEETNLKITTPVDLAIAEFILRQRLQTKG